MNSVIFVLRLDYKKEIVVCICPFIGKLISFFVFFLTSQTKLLVLTLLLVMQTGDHIEEPNDRDSILTTPAESTVTGVKFSVNL